MTFSYKCFKVWRDHAFNTWLPEAGIIFSKIVFAPHLGLYSTRKLVSLLTPSQPWVAVAGSMDWEEAEQVEVDWHAYSLKIWIFRHSENFVSCDEDIWSNETINKSLKDIKTLYLLSVIWLRPLRGHCSRLNTRVDLTLSNMFAVIFIARCSVLTV